MVSGQLGKYIYICISQPYRSTPNPGLACVFGYMQQSLVPCCISHQNQVGTSAECMWCLRMVCSLPLCSALGILVYLHSVKSVCPTMSLQTLEVIHPLAQSHPAVALMHKHVLFQRLYHCFCWSVQDPSTGEFAKARNSNLNEDLGKVEYVFSDKTGTLTSNEMQLREIAIKSMPLGSAEFK